VELHGGIDEETRNHNLYEVFQKGKARFIVANPATGGVGVSMSMADNEFFLSNSFKYIDRKQAEERGTASDQKVGTVLIDFVCEGTVDEDVLAALDQKEDVSEYVRRSIDEFKTKYEGL
jgi:SNF2 family DNA or RNA helicase